MENKPEKETQPKVGINVTVPSISKAKFEAILAIAESNKLLAQALNSVNVQATISHNQITCSGTGIFLGGNENDVDDKKW